MKITLAQSRQFLQELNNTSKKLDGKILSKIDQLTTTLVNQMETQQKQIEALTKELNAQRVIIETRHDELIRLYLNFTNEIDQKIAQLETGEP